jgi:hypothetical protein
VAGGAFQFPGGSAAASTAKPRNPSEILRIDE